MLLVLPSDGNKKLCDSRRRPRGAPTSPCVWRWPSQRRMRSSVLSFAWKKMGRATSISARRLPQRLPSVAFVAKLETHLYFSFPSAPRPSDTTKAHRHRPHRHGAPSRPSFLVGTPGRCTCPITFSSASIGPAGTSPCTARHRLARQIRPQFSLSTGFGNSGLAMIWWTCWARDAEVPADLGSAHQFHSPDTDETIV